MIYSNQIAGLADLAEAAYIDFGAVPSGGLTETQLKAALAKKDAAWPEARRDEFARHWRVVAHEPNTASGFSGTLFERINPMPGEQRFVIAMRGTEADVPTQRWPDLGSADLGDLVADGLAWKQTLDMYNWWQKISTPVGEPRMTAIAVPDPNGPFKAYEGAVLDPLVPLPVPTRYRFERVYAGLTGEGVVPDGERVDVTGHSLGGNLASAFAWLDASRTREVVTINGAGYSSIGRASGNVDYFFSALGGATSFGASNILNLYGDRGLEIVTQNIELGLQQPGGHEPVFLENNSITTNTVGHGAGQMAHSLSLYDMFRRLEGPNAPSLPAVMLSRYRPFLDAMAGDDDATFERAVDSMRQLLLARVEVPTAIGDLATFVSRLERLKADGVFTAVAGKVRIELSGADLRTRARDEFSALASLLTLSPVVLNGVDSTLNTQLRAAWGSTYDAWDADRNMLQADRDAGKQAFTDAYLNDRQAMLQWLMVRNINNIKDGVITDRSQPDAWAYEDRASDTTLLRQRGPGGHTHLITFGAVGSEELMGSGYEDHLYGGGGNDTVSGQRGADWLEGNAADDRIDGGTGDDTLLGGAGADTFIVGQDAGLDTILNADAQDRLELGGRTITGTGELRNTEGGLSVWVDESVPGAALTFLHDANQRELTIAGAGSAVLVKDFDDGELGIHIPTTPAPAPAPTPVATFDLSTSQGRYEWSVNYHLPQTDNWTVLNTNASGLVGINGAGGDDLIVGGPAIVANQTFLSGGTGRDRVFSGTEQTLAQAIAAGEQQTGTGRGVYMLAGEAGDDLVVGAGDDDALFGGTGSDTLVGGAGSDVIFADGNNDYAYTTPGMSWVTGSNDVTTGQRRQLVLSTPVAVRGTTGSDTTGQRRQVTSMLGRYIDPLAETDLSGLLAMRREDITFPDDGYTYLPDSQRTYGELTGGAWFGTNVGQGNDVIYAGAGDDVVNAGAGNDFVDGGTGVDMVAGYDGDDVVLGGAGNDQLDGDYQVAVTAGAASEALSYFGAAGAIRYTLDPARHGRDTLNGGAGDDAMYGGGAADLLYGGSGNDVMYGDHYKLVGPYAGDDHLYGQDGNDQLVGGGGDDDLIGGEGTDRLEGDDRVEDVAAIWHGADRLDGGAGDDELYGGGGADTLLGGSGNDWLAGEDQLAADASTTLAGDDRLEGGDGDDTLIGGTGVDALLGGTGKDHLYGGDGDDAVLDGGEERDNLFGGAGNDVLLGGDGDDWLAGEDQQTMLATSQLTGDDLLDGGNGNDALVGGNGKDELRGGAGDDTLYGGSGNDTLIGGAGIDWLDGGLGDDRYVLDLDDIVAGSSNVAEGLTDAGGSNTVVFGGPLRWAQTADAANMGLALGDPNQQRGVVLVNAFGGAFDTFVVEGTEVAASQWAQANVTGSVEATVVAGGRAFGGAGADKLIAIASGGSLYGGRGDDLYDVSASQAAGGVRIHFDSGDGADRVTGTVLSGTRANRSANVAEMGEGITSDSLKLEMKFDAYGAGLVTMKYGVAGDRVTIDPGWDNASSSSGRAFDRFEFADGSSLTWEELEARRVRIDMSMRTDFYAYANYGTVYNDHILGRNANDRIYGGRGDDLIDAGAGNDEIDGQWGSDVVLFGLGDGTDKVLSGVRSAGDRDMVRIKAGVTNENVMFSRRNDDLIIRFRGSSGDQLTVTGAFGGSPLDAVEYPDGSRVALSDIRLARGAEQATGGTDVIYLAWDGDTVDAMAGDDTVYGGAGDDVMQGGRGGDLLDGGAGNDLLEDSDGAQFIGGDGNDTIRGVAGTVSAGAGDDVIDVPAGQITLGRGNDTVLLRRAGPYTTVFDGAAQAGEIKTFRFTAGISPSEVTVKAVGSSLYLTWPGTGTTHSLVVNGFMTFGEDGRQGFRVQFDDAPATNWTFQDVYALANAPSDASQALWGSAGSDVIDGLGGSDEIHGLAGDDDLRGGSGDDTIYGEAGNDLLAGNDGADSLLGGDGNDTLVASSGSTELRGGAGQDVFRFGARGTHTIYRDDYGTPSDIIEFDTSVRPENVTIVASDWNHADAVLVVSVPGVPTETISINGHFDSPSPYGVAEVRFQAAPGTVWTASTLHQMSLVGNEGRNQLYGFDFSDDALTGGGGDDALTGKAGNDTLDGGFGHDAVAGGLGDDVYLYRRGGSQDLITESGGYDTLRLGAGIVPADVSMTRTSSAPIDFPSRSASNYSSDALVVSLGNGDQIWIPGQFTAAGALESIEFTDGTQWTAADIAARVAPAGGAANAMSGSVADDLYFVDHPGDTISEAAGAGVDRVSSSVSYTLPTNVEDLALTGRLNTAGSGNDLGNSIGGSAGDNVLNGGKGVDTLTGGLGDDIYIITSDQQARLYNVGANGVVLADADATALAAEDPWDVVVEAANEGRDLLVTSQYRVRLPDHVEDLVVASMAVHSLKYDYLQNASNTLQPIRFLDAYRNYDGRASDTRPWFIGNALANCIDVTDGHPGTTFSGYSAATFNGVLIDGGAGADTMIGGSEDTYYVVDDPGDEVRETGVQSGGAQQSTRDTMVSSNLSLTLAANIENLELLGSLALSATGDDGNNELRASKNTAANDLTGRGGDDVYFVDASDRVFETADGGIDTVVIDSAAIGDAARLSSGAVFRLADYGNVENIAANGFVEWNYSPWGSSVPSEGVHLIGNEADNRVLGSWQADVLEGGAGNDVIEDQQRSLLPSMAALMYDVDTLNGGAGNDRLVAWFGNDVLNGGDGNDTLVGGAVSFLEYRQVLSGGLGDDVYEANSASTLTEFADAGRDLVKALGGISWTLGDNFEDLELSGSANGTGNAQANRIVGGDDANRLNGLGGADTLIGGRGDDTYVVDDAGDLLIEQIGEGVDTVESSIDLTLQDQFENLVLLGTGNLSGHGNAANNLLTGNGGGNMLFGGAGNDTLDGGAGDDELDGGSGVDVYRFGRGGGRDTLLQSTPEAGTINTLLLTGGIAQTDLALWRSGNDVKVAIRGATDVVTVRSFFEGSVAGGPSSPLQRIEFSDGSSWDLAQIVSNIASGPPNEAPTLAGPIPDLQLEEGQTLGFDLAPGTFVDADAGDQLLYSATLLDGSPLPAWLSIDTQTGRLEAITAPAGSIDIRVVATDREGLFAADEFGIVVMPKNWHLVGSAGDDVLVGSTGNDTLDGVGGNDSLVGASGDDLLIGGTGVDTMDGGTGDDVYRVDSASDVVLEFAGAGWDTIESTVSLMLPDNVDVLRLQGADSVSGTGNAGTNFLVGNNAANRLDGGAGFDSLMGGAGDDTYVVDHNYDYVIEAAGGGIDGVESSVNWTLAAELENLLLTGNSSIAGAGNSADNRIVGNSAANTLTGWAGNDTLDGGIGNDTMIGGTGDDTYFVNVSTDVISEAPGEGTDTVLSNVTLTLGSNVENLELTGTGAINGTGNTLSNKLTGNRVNNTLTGGAGDDTLDGGAGTDSMAGGVGNDVYIVERAADVVTEAAGEGTDTVLSSVTLTLATNVENLTLTGTGAINATGNILNNVLLGNGGNNTLSGGTGNDSMMGGAGDDIYIVDATGDTVTEDSGDGTDTVQSGVTWTLSANIEKLTLTGTNSINGTGNSLDNVLIGNSANNTLTGGAGNDTLNGGAGNDTMIGGLGNDTYVVNVSTDVVTEVANEGTDTVQSSVTLTLGANVENLTLTGTSALKATGNILDNVLTGNSANNTLSGGAGNDTLDGGVGNDTMVGGAGNDTYVVNVSTDVVTEAANEGMDTVLSAVTLTLGSNVENLTLTGAGAINGTGNTLNNVLIGNGAANVLTGAAGDDTYDGGAGNDTFTDTSTTSNETYRWGIGSGIDTLTDSGGAQDHVDLFAGIAHSDLRFTRTGDNLDMTVAGQADKLTISNWFSSSANQIEEFRFSDGSKVFASDVGELLNVGLLPAPMALTQTASGRKFVQPVASGGRFAVEAMSGQLHASTSIASIEKQVHLLVSALATFYAGETVGEQAPVMVRWHSTAQLAVPM